MTTAIATIIGSVNKSPRFLCFCRKNGIPNLAQMLTLSPSISHSRSFFAPFLLTVNVSVCKSSRLTFCIYIPDVEAKFSILSGNFPSALMNSFYYAISVFAFNKNKTHHVGLHQNKSYYPAKEIINKMKRQPTEWEKNICKPTI